MKIIKFIREEGGYVAYIFVEYIVPLLCGVIGSFIGMAFMIRLGIW